MLLLSFGSNLAYIACHVRLWARIPEKSKTMNGKISQLGTRAILSLPFLKRLWREGNKIQEKKVWKLARFQFSKVQIFLPILFDFVLNKKEFHSTLSVQIVIVICNSNWITFYVLWDFLFFFWRFIYLPLQNIIYPWHVLTSELRREDNLSRKFFFER